jgi:hypothetical protein
MGRTSEFHDCTLEPSVNHHSKTILIIGVAAILLYGSSFCFHIFRNREWRETVDIPFMSPAVWGVSLVVICTVKSGLFNEGK